MKAEERLEQSDLVLVKQQWECFTDPNKNEFITIQGNWETKNHNILKLKIHYRLPQDVKVQIF